MVKDKRPVYTKLAKSRISTINVSPAFRGLLLDFTVTFLIEQPPDIVQFGIDYFAQLKAKYTCTPTRRFPMDNQMETEEEEEEEEMIIKRRRKTIYTVTENLDDDELLPVYPKTEAQRKVLVESFKTIVLFSELSNDEINTILNAMFKRTVQKGELVINQGDEGDYFYIIQFGVFHAFTVSNGVVKTIRTYNNSGSFGELALLQDTPRWAGVQALSYGELWCLDRKTFRKIVLKSAYKKRKMYLTFIDQVPLLQQLNSDEKMNLADALEPRYFKAGEIIIQEGDPADGMFFVESGAVIVKRASIRGTRTITTTVEKGGYFGEMALITKQKRAATVRATVDTKLAFLKSDAFERFLGPCKNIMERSFERYMNI